MAVFGNRAAMFADTAWFDGRATIAIWSNAVQRARNDTCGGGFTNPAHPGQNKCMGKTSTFKGV